MSNFQPKTLHTAKFWAEIDVFFLRSPTPRPKKKVPDGTQKVSDLNTPPRDLETTLRNLLGPTKCRRKTPASILEMFIMFVICYFSRERNHTKDSVETTQATRSGGPFLDFLKARSSDENHPNVQSMQDVKPIVGPYVPG